MRSQLFYTDAYLGVQQRVKAFLNAQKDYLSPASLESPRAVGDAIQELLGDEFGRLLGDLCTECNSDFARRAMADVAFTGRDGMYYIVDVKTHRTDTQFSMPNLTSVKRLARFYESDANCFAILLVSYVIANGGIAVSEARFMPIEFLGWDCLTLGALGWGQIQIANSNVVTIRPQYSRKTWMLEMCDNLLEFYPREIAKIGTRVKHFKRVQDVWRDKPDIWAVKPIEPPKTLKG